LFYIKNEFLFLKSYHAIDLLFIFVGGKLKKQQLCKPMSCESILKNGVAYNKKLSTSKQNEKRNKKISIQM
jgi:hypothetical protein